MEAREVQELYTASADGYLRFAAAFGYRQGLGAVIAGSGLLRPGLRVLDAGCGAGTVTFALLDALERQKIGYQTIDAFDLTPAMLERFAAGLAARGCTEIHPRQANVLALDEQLPGEWRGYDLILSASMLEYLPKEQLPVALASLRARLAPGGTLLVFITRANLPMRVLIGWLWRSETYRRAELARAFAAAGLREVGFLSFPWRWFWLNQWGYVVKAKC